MSDSNAEPLVSVLLPVLSGEYLSHALDSILRQTYSNWEVVLVDDGSDPATKQLIKQYAYKDERIRVLTHESNTGIVVSLNEAVKASRGSLLARMDADDTAAPDRLTRQVAYLQAHPDVHVVGGGVLIVSSSNPKGRLVEMPTEPGEVHATLFWNCCLVHPAVLCRRSLLETIPYEESFRYAEDYRLWLHAAQAGGYKLANLPRPAVLSLRKHAGNASVQHKPLQRERAIQSLSLAWQHILELTSPRQAAPASKEEQGKTPNHSTTAVQLATAFHSPSLPQDSATLTAMCDALTRLEVGLLQQSQWGSRDSSAIRDIITRKMGELATLDFVLNGGNASLSSAWRTWLSRSPAQQMASLMSLMAMNPPISTATATNNSNTGATASQVAFAGVHKDTHSGTTLPVMGSTAAAPNVDQLTVICFSKDRAFQLSEYLRTLLMFAADTVTLHVHVLWTASTPRFEESYLTLAAQYASEQPSVVAGDGDSKPRTVQVHFLRETNFAQQLEELVEGTVASYILWGVDDVLYYSPVDFQESMKILTEQEDVLCAHFRLSPNVTYCHPSDAFATLPTFHPVSVASSRDSASTTLLKYNRFETDQDWNYPFELCATLMRKPDIVDTLQLIKKHFGVEGLSHPNKLEVCGSKLFSRKLHPKHSIKWCLCMQSPVLSVITVNRVQDVCENRVFEEISLETLDDFFRQNKQMDLVYYRSTKFNSVHIGDFVLLK